MEVYKSGNSPEPEPYSAKPFYPPPKTPCHIKGKLLGSQHPNQTLIDRLVPKPFKGLLYEKVELDLWTIELYLHGETYVGSLQFNVDARTSISMASSNDQTIVNNIKFQIEESCNRFLKNGRQN